MVANKKPQRCAVKKADGGKPAAKIMDNQDTVNKGDSRAVRTVRMTFSTRPEVQAKIAKAAHDRWISRSRLIEEAILAYLGEGEG